MKELKKINKIKYLKELDSEILHMLEGSEEDFCFSGKIFLADVMENAWKICEQVESIKERQKLLKEAQ